MGTVLLLVRLALAAVFAVAGAAKLADLPGSRRAVGDFGVPAGLATVLGTLLPLAELATAAALLFEASAWASSVAALALLLAFSAGIANVIRRGEEVDCHCFGQLQSSQAGPATLARNLGLAAAAALLVLAGSDDAGPGAFGWLADLDATEATALGTGVALALALAGGGWLATNLLRQNGRLLLRVEALETALRTGGQLPDPVDPDAEGLPLGVAAPPFAVADPDGGATSLDDLLAPGLPLMLLFTDPNCGPCQAMEPAVAAWQTDHAERLTIRVLEGQREVAEAYEVVPTPSAVLVDAAGTIASAVASGENAIRGLLDRALERPSVVQVAARSAPAPAPAPGPAVGSAAPEVKLPDLDGETVEVAAFGGADSMLMFWNPGCGFCDAMLDELRAWEADPPAGAPQLVFVSSGDLESNREMGLRSPVLMDASMATMTAFGASGTPMAIGIDAHGRVASDLAAGAPAVWAALRNGNRA